MNTWVADGDILQRRLPAFCLHTLACEPQPRNPPATAKNLVTQYLCEMRNDRHEHLRVLSTLGSVSAGNCGLLWPPSPLPRAIAQPIATLDDLKMDAVQRRLDRRIHAILALVSCWEGGAQLLGRSWQVPDHLQRRRRMIHNCLPPTFRRLRNSFFALADIANTFSVPSEDNKRITEET